MLGFEERWDEHGRGLGKETSKARIQRGFRPETLESNKTCTQRDGQTIGKAGEHRKDNRVLGIIFGCHYETRAHKSMLIYEIKSSHICRTEGTEARVRSRIWV